MLYTWFSKVTFNSCFHIVYVFCLCSLIIVTFLICVFDDYLANLILHIQIFAAPHLSQHYLHQMVSCVKDHTNVLPGDISSDFPSYACLLGNLLEVAGVAIAQNGSFAWVK